MRKFLQRVVVLMLAVAVINPSLVLAAHAPKFPKKDHPVMRQHKAQRTANKKARAMEVKHGLLGLH